MVLLTYTAWQSSNDGAQWSRLALDEDTTTCSRTRMESNPFLALELGLTHGLAFLEIKVPQDCCGE